MAGHGIAEYFCGGLCLLSICVITHSAGIKNDLELVASAVIVNFPYDGPWGQLDFHSTFEGPQIDQAVAAQLVAHNQHGDWQGKRCAFLLGLLSVFWDEVLLDVLDSAQLLLLQRLAFQ